MRTYSILQALGDFAGGFSVPQSFGNQEGQIDTRKVMSRREDMSCNVMGSNSVARNIFFLCNLYFFDHLAMELAQ